MEVYLSEQFSLCLRSFVCGILLSAFYDLLVFFRVLAGDRDFPARAPEFSSLSLPLLKRSAEKAKLKKSGKAGKRVSGGFLFLLTFFEDLLFFTVAAASMLTVFFSYGKGRPRLIAILFAAAGFFVAHFSVGRAATLIFGYLRLFVEILLRYVLLFALAPIRFFAQPVIKCAKSIYRRLKRVYNKKRRAAYTKRELARLAESLSGLLPDGENNKKTEAYGEGKRYRITY